MTTQAEFPKKIQHAFAYVAGRRGTANELSNNGRHLLTELIRSTSVSRPSESIRVSTVALQAALGLSARTIYRLKTELEVLGWISRSQVKCRTLGMQISDIRLTNKALTELGFIEPTEAPETRKELQKLTKVVLPKDLEFLQGEGLSAFSILALMKFAKAQKTRLSDVVHCIKERLASVKNKYSYIYAVLKASFNKDWAYEKSKVDAADAERLRNSSAPNKTPDNAPGPVILNAVRNAPETVNPEDLILGIPKAAFESLNSFMKEKLVYKLTVGSKTTNFMRDGEEFKSNADKSDSWKIMSHLSMLSYGCKAGNLQLT